MSVYFVTGKLGSGKTLACVGRIKQALLEGRRVATNLDLRVEKLVGARSRAVVMRLPDQPSLADLEAIGLGQEGVEESRNGLVVLDECGAWLNAREWGDKQRAKVLDWMLHSRKLGWDVYFIAQGLVQLDKQLRETMVEYHVSCKRADRLGVPVLGGIWKVLTGKRMTMPKVHLGVVRYGAQQDAMVVDRWWYRARELYEAYDTRQRFLPPGAPGACGLHSMLSAWHVAGRYERATVPWWERARAWVAKPRRVLKAKLPQVVAVMGLEPDVRVGVVRSMIERGVL